MYNRTYHEKILGRTDTPKVKKPFNWRIFFMVLLGTVLILGIIFISRHPRLQVNAIEITGIDVTDPEVVQNFIEKEMNGNIFFVFPKRSMLFVPTATISKSVAKEFPIFESVDVRRKGVNDLSVEIVERKGKYLWCLNQDSCMFMTDTGLVYGTSPDFSGNAYIKIFGGEEGELPFFPLNEKNLSMVEIMKDKFSTLDIDVTAIKFVSDRELEVTFQREARESLIYFDPNNDLNSAFEALYTAMRTESFATQYQNESKILKYIDLRFPNKVVYKFE